MALQPGSHPLQFGGKAKTMTAEELKTKTKKLEDLWGFVYANLSKEIVDKIKKIIELENKIELECNK